jgi:tetratricopeptide (TPR) repeat protein
MGSQSAVFHSFGALGHAARQQGEFEQARAFYEESLRLRQQAGDTNALIVSLEDFAELAAAEQQWRQMARLLGAAIALREAAGMRMLEGDRLGYDRLIQGAQAALGQDAFAAAWAEGERMTLDKAIQVALAHDEPPVAPEAGSGGLADNAREVRA